MASHRVLVSDPISETGVELLNAHPDITADFKTGLAPEELISIIGDYDALVVRSQTKVTNEVLTAAGKLRAVGRAGACVDRVGGRGAARTTPAQPRGRHHRRVAGRGAAG